jgi:hypothetical protein
MKNSADPDSPELTERNVTQTRFDLQMLQYRRDKTLYIVDSDIYIVQQYKR